MSVKKENLSQNFSKIVPWKLPSQHKTLEINFYPNNKTIIRITLTNAEYTN